MNCLEFQANIDRYVDAVPGFEAPLACGDHVERCCECNALVTSYQQMSSLLKTAVADRATAVDVSGLWEAIDRSLDTVRPTSGSHGWVSSKPSLPDRLGAWLGAWAPPLRVGALAAATAVVAALWWGAGSQPSFQPERVARAKTKAVRIEALEVPSGYTVATWSRPRTRTRIISINKASAYTLASSSRHR